MKKLALVTDSASYLSKEFMKEHNIFLLPLNVVFQNETLEEITDMSEEDFYEKLRKEHPKTAQPTFGKVVDLYKKLKQDGYTDIFSVHCSSELSGSYNSSIQAAEIAEVKVHSIDSRIGSYPMSKILLTIEELYATGVSNDEILEKVNFITQRSHLYFIPASLQQLKKSGRVSGSQALLGSILNIKLICRFEEGKIVLYDKTRSEKKAINIVINELQKSLDNGNIISEVAVIHCNEKEKALTLCEELKKSFSNINFIQTPLSAAVGTHAGEKTMGLSWTQDN